MKKKSLFEIELEKAYEEMNTEARKERAIANIKYEESSKQKGTL